MRRFPRPFPLDNDTAPKNGVGIPEAGHKRARRARPRWSVLVAASLRAAVQAKMIVGRYRRPGPGNDPR